MLIKMSFLLIGARIVLKIVLIEKAKVICSKSFFLVLYNMDSQERSILLHSFVELKNQLIQQVRYTDCVDEFIFNVIHALIKKLRTEPAGKMMYDKEFKESVKIAVKKLKDESALKLLQADDSYQKDSKDEEKAEDKTCRNGVCIINFGITNFFGIRNTGKSNYVVQLQPIRRLA